MRRIDQFTLFASCVPVKGAKRSVIYDLERNKFDLIPNILYHLLTEKDLDIKNNILQKIPKDIQDEYFSFLTNKDYLVPEESAMDICLSALDLSWDYPAEVANAIFLIDNNSLYLNNDFLDRFEEKGCCHYQVVVKSNITTCNLIDIIRLFKNRNTKKLQLFTPYHRGIEELFEESFFRNHPFCQNVIVYNCPYSNTEQGLFYFILYIKGQLYDSPGNYSFFFPNVRLFAESQSYNTYYNRKVVVDENGFYRLGLHNSTKYGNVNKILLHELITSKSYTKYWSISKDKIEKCKDCEFRYMCIDSRLPEYNTNKGVYCFNTECSYSPYTCEWNIKKIPFLNNY